MDDNKILMCLIALILGYLLSKHMGGNGFTIGGEENCNQCPHGTQLWNKGDTRQPNVEQQIGNGWRGYLCWNKSNPDYPDGLCVGDCLPGLYEPGSTELENYPSKKPECKYCELPTDCPSPPGDQNYSCSGTECIEDDDGDYDNDDCDGRCLLDQNYSCSGTKCIEDEGGEYDNDDCDDKCKAVTKYSCSGIKCIVDSTGKYTDVKCDNECAYSCSGTECVKDSTGDYGDDECDDKCSHWWTKWWGILLIILAVIFGLLSFYGLARALSPTPPRSIQRLS